MANGTPAGGSVQQTSLVALGTGYGLVVLQWLVHPSWPPPEAVLTIVATACSPVVHLLGRAIYNRLTLIADQLDDGVVNNAAVAGGAGGAPAAGPVVQQPQVAVPAPPVAPAVPAVPRIVDPPPSPPLGNPA